MGYSAFLAGALTGVNYVSGQIGRTAQVNLDYVNDKRYLGLGNLILHKSIFNFDFLFGEISDTLIPFDGKPLPNLPVLLRPLPPIVRPASSFAEKHSCTDIYAAIRASASMPLLSPMVMVEGQPCLDGGVSLSIPYQKPLDEGYEKVVVITTREHGFRKPQVTRPIARFVRPAVPKISQSHPAAPGNPSPVCPGIGGIGPAGSPGKALCNPAAQTSHRVPNGKRCEEAAGPLRGGASNLSVTAGPAVPLFKRLTQRSSSKYFSRLPSTKKGHPDVQDGLSFLREGTAYFPKNFRPTKASSTKGTNSSSTKRMTSMRRETPQAASITQNSRVRAITASIRGSNRSNPERVEPTREISSDSPGSTSETVPSPTAGSGESQRVPLSAWWKIPGHRSIEPVCSPAKREKRSTPPTGPKLQGQLKPIAFEKRFHMSSLTTKRSRPLCKGAWSPHPTEKIGLPRYGLFPTKACTAGFGRYHRRW